MGTLQWDLDQLRGAWDDIEFWNEELSTEGSGWVPGELLAGMLNVCNDSTVLSVSSIPIESCGSHGNGI